MSVRVAVYGCAAVHARTPVHTPLTTPCTSGPPALQSTTHSFLCLGVFFGQVVVENLPRGTSWQDLKDFMRKAGDVGFSEVNRDGTLPRTVAPHTHMPPWSFCCSLHVATVAPLRQLPVLLPTLLVLSPEHATACVCAYSLADDASLYPTPLPPPPPPFAHAHWWQVWVSWSTATRMT